ncbi:hypothetical protein XELAEV_18004676mg [Xenopus laevis]|uniref:Uncharacterized protein n=1 Tax=Xenopus laevis TaxID=8355 RepID=A0A974BR28_XENLA|nr:hypothetical protein XELAEV_18004676mg [Xenopus laevis]
MDLITSPTNNDEMLPASPVCQCTFLLMQVAAPCYLGSTFPVSWATNSYLIPLSQLAFNYCISDCQRIGGCSVCFLVCPPLGL